MRRRCAGRLTPVVESNSTVSSSTMRPRSGVTNPAIILTKVVLPAPDGPNNAVTPLFASKRTASEKSPSFFSASTDSISISVEAGAGAARQPFGGDQRRERDDDGDDNQPARRAFATRHLHEGVDCRRDGLRLAGNIGHEGDGGAELAQRLGEAEHHAGDDARQGQRQRNGQEGA